MNEGGRWRLTVPGALHWRRWADEVVVYDAASGDTHLFEPAGAEILHRLESAPATVADLTAGLVAGGVTDPDPTALSYVAAFVARLHRLGLVEPA
jgi:PqqD family protein of HPr-rel-A system